MAAFCQRQRAAGLLVVPRAAHIAVGEMVIADVFVVLNGHHRAELPAGDDLPEPFKEGRMAKHMAHRHHLPGEDPGQAGNLPQLVQRGGDRLFQDQIIALFQQPPNIPQVQLILRGDNGNVGKPGLRHHVKVGIKDLPLSQAILASGARLLGRVGIRHRNQLICVRSIRL